MRLAIVALLAAAPLWTGCDSFDPESIGPGATCGDFTSQADAQDYFEFYGSAASNLDADNDGIACESL